MCEFLVTISLVTTTSHFNKLYWMDGWKERTINIYCYQLTHSFTNRYVCTCTIFLFFYFSCHAKLLLYTIGYKFKACFWIWKYLHELVKENIQQVFEWFWKMMPILHIYTHYQCNVIPCNGIWFLWLLFQTSQSLECIGTKRVVGWMDGWLNKFLWGCSGSINIHD